MKIGDLLIYTYDNEYNGSLAICLGLTEHDLDGEDNGIDVCLFSNSDDEFYQDSYFQNECAKWYSVLHSV